MLLFDKRYDLNPNIKKVIDSVSRERITIRYGNSNIILENPKLLLEITKGNFKYNEETKKYDLTLSKFKDLNMMTSINGINIIIDKIDFESDHVQPRNINNKTYLYLFDNIKEIGSNYIYEIPIIIADILTVLQDFSISKRW